MVSDRRLLSVVPLTVARSTSPSPPPCRPRATVLPDSSRSYSVPPTATGSTSTNSVCGMRFASTGCRLGFVDSAPFPSPAPVFRPSTSGSVKGRRRVSRSQSCFQTHRNRSSPTIEWDDTRSVTRSLTSVTHSGWFDWTSSPLSVICVFTR